MSFSLTAHTAAGSADGKTVTTSAIDTTGANLIVICLSDFTSQTIDTITDSKSNTWTALTSYPVSASTRETLFYSLNPTVGSGHTFTATLGGGITTAPAIGVQAWSGAVASSVLDQTNGLAGSLTGTSIQPGSVTPGSNNELVVCGLGVGVGATSAYAIDSSFTISDQVALSAGLHFGMGMAYLVQTTAGAVNPTWSWTTVAPRASSIATFKAATGGGGVIKTIEIVTYSSMKTLEGSATAVVKTIEGVAAQ